MRDHIVVDVSSKTVMSVGFVDDGRLVIRFNDPSCVIDVFIDVGDASMLSDSVSRAATELVVRDLRSGDASYDFEIVASPEEKD